MPGGRPPKYQPTYCEELVNFATEGGSLTAFAGEIGVGRNTLDGWKEQYPEFSGAVDRAKAKRAAWWDMQGRKLAANGGTGGQSTMVIFGLKNHASDDYRDMTEQRITGEVKQIVEHRIVSDALTAAFLRQDERQLVDVTPPKDGAEYGTDADRAKDTVDK